METQTAVVVTHGDRYDADAALNSLHKHTVLVMFLVVTSRLIWIHVGDFAMLNKQVNKSEKEHRDYLYALIEIYK